MPPVSLSSGWSKTHVKRNFHEKKNSMKDTVARGLMIGDSTLYASAMVARSEIRGRTRPKSAYVLRHAIAA